MRTTTLFSVGRHRLVMAVLALTLAVGALGVTGGFGPDWATSEVRAAVPDGGDAYR
jgi:hypothetical protein